jgi:hypothetical protein
MEITRSGSQKTSKGPAEWFTGSVRIQPLFEAPEPARVRGFEFGEILLVVSSKKEQSDARCSF